MTIYEGETNRRRAIVALNRTNSTILKEMLNSYKCKITSVDEGSGIIVYQDELINEIVKLINYID